MPSGAIGLIPASVEKLLHRAFGGNDGVVRFPDESGAVTETDPQTMGVSVEPFLGFLDGRIIENRTAAASGLMTAPTGGSLGDVRRKDLVQFTRGAGVNVVTGVEGSSPAAPSVSANSIALAEVWHRNGETAILTEDDTSNGYVVDRRVFV